MAATTQTTNSPSQPGQKTVQRFRQMYVTASAASVGLELALAVVIGWAFGAWLDGQLGTDPWMMLLFLCFGIAAGFKGVIRVARQASRVEPDPADSESKG
jgi:ATP synthase protein I